MTTDVGVGAWEWVANLLGPDGCTVEDHALAQHARDEGFTRRGRRYRPDVVAYPQSTGEVAELVRGAGHRNVCVTPWGAGTSMEGNGLPTRGGIVVDMTRMNKVVAVHPEDLQVVVQPGILRLELNQQLSQYGLFFPPDPGAPATIGGMVANNASGTKSVRYGVTADYVLALEVVLADGTVVRTGSRAVKSASGYRLTSLFVGSEGTLGVITEITLRLAPVPAAVSGALARFSSLDHAARAVSAMIAAGVTVAMAELIDGPIIRLLNAENDLGWPELATILLEFSGSSEAAVDAELGLAKGLILDIDPDAELTRSSVDEHRKLTALRHGLGPTIYRSSLKPNIRVLDVTVPISRYADLVRASREIVARYGLEAYQLGHAGDGNLHVLLLNDSRDDAELDVVDRIEDEIVAKALEFDGTTTGEHGVGLGRMRFMDAEHGAAVEVMRAIKRALDPAIRLNPGKIVAIDG